MTRLSTIHKSNSGNEVSTRIEQEILQAVPGISRLQDIPVTTAFTVVGDYAGCPKPESLQRRLQGTLLKFVRKMLRPESRMLDIASSTPRLGEFLGIKNIETADVTDSATYKESVEGDCTAIPRGAYDLVTCTNYFLLCHDSQRAVGNIHSFLKPGGMAILDFIGTTYWYRATDGVHWQSYTPEGILELTKDFSERLIVPVGNFAQAFMNYYAKRSPRNLARILFFVGGLLGRFDKNPTGAIHYFCFARK